jgi:Prp8 binding protein
VKTSQLFVTVTLVACAGHKNAVVELHWTSDGERVVTASPDKSVRAWDVASGQQVKKMAEHDSFVNSCCPLRRGPPLLVSGSDDGTAKVGMSVKAHAAFGG